MSKWTPEDMHRRSYSVESPALDAAKRVELKIIVDGKVWVHMQAREPGIMAFVSHPADQGFNIEIIEAKGVQFIDMRTPDGEMNPALAEWQKEALGLK